MWLIGFRGEYHLAKFRYRIAMSVIEDRGGYEDGW
jgi:hypothetical protein